jgi:pyrimidine operon attenuation protein/uracil phosphoribosyltransferase
MAKAFFITKIKEENMANYKATILDEAAVLRALKRISHEILEKNNGPENVVLVGIKRRGVPIAKIIADNIKQIENTEVPVGEIDITYYRDDLKKEATEPVIHDSKIDINIKDKKVIMVDDVLYTGRTARAAMEALISNGRPSAIQLAVLVDRGHRELPIRGDFVGKNVPTSKSEIIKVKIPPYEDSLSVELFG